MADQQGEPHGPDSTLEAELAAVLAGEIDRESALGQDILERARRNPELQTDAEELAGMEALAEALEFHGMEEEVAARAPAGSPDVDMSVVLAKAIAIEDGQDSTHASAGGGRLMWFRFAAVAAALIAMLGLSVLLRPKPQTPPMGGSPGSVLGGQNDESGVRLSLEKNGKGEAVILQWSEGPAGAGEQLTLQIQREDTEQRWTTFHEQAVDGAVQAFEVEALGSTGGLPRLRARVLVRGEIDEPGWSYLP